MGQIIQKPTGFRTDFVRKPGNFPKVTHYCPGCGHGRVHKLIAEALSDLGMVDDTVFISPVGCSVFGYYYFNTGNIQAAHGRAPAVGTGVARSNAGKYVISYQGDGDLAAIGTAEIMHAANRGENMTVIFVNNTIYGMTGGQMAPTTLEGQRTTTSPYGRDIEDVGAPIRMAEIIAQLQAPVYVERVAVTNSKEIQKTKRAIRKALETQKKQQGFSFVEILSACPIGWKMTPVDAIKRIETEVIPYFPLNNFKDETASRAAKKIVPANPTEAQIIEALGLNKTTTLFEKDKNYIAKFPEQQIRIAGFGGQGVLLAGTTLGYLGMELGLNTTWLPSYGPEMRGGTASCHVVLSNTTIGSPLVEEPDVLIAMNRPSLEEFVVGVKKGGLVLVNSSVVDIQNPRSDVNTLYIPMTQIAADCGVRQAANMVAVASYVAYTKLIPMDALIKFVSANFKKKNLIEQNVAVIRAAEKFIAENYS